MQASIPAKRPVHNAPSAISRRNFLRRLGLSAAGAALGSTALPAVASAEPRASRFGSEFVFARLRYNSGDWDYNPKVCANVLDSVVRYTKIPVRQNEVVITADSPEMLAFPFVFMTGHKLVRFSEKERDGLVKYVQNGGLLFSDDCNHDINGLYAKSFESEIRRAFPGTDTLAKLRKNHPIYNSFFKFPDGPPQTTHELNGWGDNVVHDYTRGVEYLNRLGILYTNQDYGCEWDYNWQNKRFRRSDNTRFSVNIVVYAMT